MTSNRTWHAKWIWDRVKPPADDAGAHQLVYFRRTFTVPVDIKPKLRLDITADSRYRLYVNGHSVCVGPCKGDQFTHYYETVDVSHLLKPGINVLSVVVLHYAFSQPFQPGVSGPMSIWRSQSGGLLVEGILQDETGHEVEPLHTDDLWKCRTNSAYRVVPSPLVMWLGGTEEVDGRGVPHGWTKADHDDSNWNTATPFSETKRLFGELKPWLLAPRPIPFLYEKETRFVSVTRSEGISKEHAERWIRADGHHDATQMTLPPLSRLVLEVDAGELTTGYLSLAMLGGQGSTIRILCAECYEPKESQVGSERRRVKGVRDDASGKLVGAYDVYQVSGVSEQGVSEQGEGGQNVGGQGVAEQDVVGQAVETEGYEPFWFRTFRFVRLEVEVGDSPLVLKSFTYRETGYPLDVQANFQSSDAALNTVWEQSVRTLRRCMHETYEDCPYYEQLQYLMDTRLQMLYTYQVSADDRLARRTLWDFHSSQLPNGMLQSRYPSALPQVIPSFALYFVDMVDEHYRYFGDLGIVKQYRPTILGLLDCFENRKQDTGLIGPMPSEYWTYFDWVPGWPMGAPAWSHETPVIMLSLMVATALRKAAELLRLTGWADAGQEMLTRAESMCEAVRMHAWSEERGLFRDGVGIEAYSQHTQVWAVLSGAVSGQDARRLMERTLDEQLYEVSLPMAYLLFTALEKVGMYQEAFDLWDRWRVFARLNLTTLPETAGDDPRSDCHAWSAVALMQFPATVLGVRPDQPGYGSIRIEPHIDGLSWAKGRVATVKGPVDVNWQIDGGRFEISVSGPKGVPAIVHLPDGTEHRFTGAIDLVCSVN